MLTARLHLAWPHFNCSVVTQGYRRPYNLVNSTGAEVNTQGSFGSVPDDGVFITGSDICEFPRITVVFLFE